MDTNIVICTVTITGGLAEFHANAPGVAAILNPVAEYDEKPAKVAALIWCTSR
jgi:hypothetical protein